MEYVFGIVILLGVLVFFHELGHFLVAKAFNVKVEVFSLGFGPKLIKKKVGETEYCISLIPLGGYVKLFGEDPTRTLTGRDAKRSFSNQNVWKRIAIAAAGPGFNIIFAIGVYFVIEVGGLEKLIVPYLADVAPDSQAWSAGLRPGDKILTVNQKEVFGWQKGVLSEIAKHPGKRIPITYLRKGEQYATTVDLGTEKRWSMLCEKEDVGVLAGASVRAAAAVIGVTDPKSLAAKMGFKTGDRIVSLNGVEIDYWHQLKDYLQNIAQSDLNFKVLRIDAPVDIRASLPPEYFMLTGDQKQRFLGMYSYEFFVRSPFSEATAGHEAGLKVGDRLIELNGDPLKNWEEFREKVQTYGRDPGHFKLTYDRGGEITTVRVSPKSVKGQFHPCEKEDDVYQIGIMLDMNNIYPPLQLVPYQQKNPFKAVYSATGKTFFMTTLIIKSVVAMFQGRVSVKSMGGPILIGKVAGDYLKQGILPFLALMAAISVNLAILNLLPIPVLDGGHLFFFFYEVIFRRRLSERVMEYANRAGLVFILCLVVLSFYNDISRYWSGIVSFFRNAFGV